MRSDNLHLPCVQPSISLYNPQLPHGCHGHHGGHGHGYHGRHGQWPGHGGKHGGQDRTKLTFKIDFPGNLCLAAFAILAMCLTLASNLLQTSALPFCLSFCFRLNVWILKNCSLFLFEIGDDSVQWVSQWTSRLIALIEIELFFRTLLLAVLLGGNSTGGIGGG